MAHEKHSAELRKMIERASALQKRVQESIFPPDPLLDDLIEELTTASEALLQSQEELSLQESALLGAQDEINAERQRYQQLFELAPDGYVVTDLNGVVKIANQVAAAMLGINSQYMIQKPLAVYVAPDDRRFFRQQLNLLRKNSAQQHWELNLRPRNLPDLDVQVSVVPSVLLFEGTSELLWQLQDMTEYKQREQAEREQFFSATFEQSPVGMGHLGRYGEWLRVNPVLCGMFSYTTDDLQLRSFFDMALPEDRNATRASFAELIDGACETLKLEQRYRSKYGEIVWTLTNITAIRAPSGEFLYAIAVVEDITQRKLSEAAEREQRLLAETLRDTALALTSSLDFSEVTDHILTNIGRIVPHDAASLLLLKGETAFVTRARGYGQLGEALEADLQDFEITIADSDRIQQMLRTKNPVLIPLWLDHGSWDQVPGMVAMCSLVAVPILEHEQVVGFLKLHSRTSDFFRPEHAALLQIFALQAAIAIQNAHAHEAAQELAITNERHRLARELHDAVTQTLYSANMIADTLPRLWEDTPHPVQEQLAQLQMLTQGALAEMRTLLLELRPENLTNINLEAQIKLLVDALKVRKRVDIQFTARMQVIIPNVVRVAFYRITQEALNNIVKHARATEIRVLLEAQHEYLRLVVQDNGIGFEDDSVQVGFGLNIMHERANEIGAQLEITSLPQSGTRICVTWGELEENDDVHANVSYSRSDR